MPKTTAPKPTPLAELKRQASALLDGELKYFIGARQIAAVRQGMRGEEGRFFCEKMIEIATLIAGMPKTGEQDGLGDNAVVHLHYFAGGCANAWITEKDRGGESGETEGGDSGRAGDGTADLNQYQAFGLANLFGGPEDAELGYISLSEEWLPGHAELDFYFKPRTIGELKGRKPVANVIVPPSSPDTEIEADAARHESAPMVSTSARSRLASL